MNKVIKENKGLFIVFEGGEGAGKSEALARIKQYLESLRIDVVTTREPGGCAAAEDTRSLIMKHEWSKEAEVHLFVAARLEHCVQTINPALEAGKIVISDRYTPSSFVYQGIVGECGLDYVVDANKHVTQPDIVIYFDVEPETGIARIFANSNREVTRFDEMDMSTHHKLREAYKSLADKDLFKRFEIIDANQTREEVQEDLKKVINSLIK